MFWVIQVYFSNLRNKGESGGTSGTNGAGGAGEGGERERENTGVWSREDPDKGGGRGVG